MRVSEECMDTFSQTFTFFVTKTLTQYEAIRSAAIHLKVMRAATYLSRVIVCRGTIASLQDAGMPILKKTYEGEIPDDVIASMPSKNARENAKRMSMMYGPKHEAGGALMLDLFTARTRHRGMMSR